MKTYKFIANLTAAIVSLAALSACGGDKDVLVESVKLSSSSLSIMVGEEATLTATVLPENATNVAVSWTSGNTAVATVADGVVTGVSEGSATISVITEDGSKTASCLVTVSDYHATSVVVSPAEKQELKKGETVQLSATVSPDNAINKSVTWSSSDYAVANVDANGLVTAVGGGEATITATTVDGGLTASVSVFVKVPCEGVALSASSLEFYEGIYNTELKLSFTPADCSNKEVEWSYDEKVLTVSVAEDGTVTLLGTLEGETTLKVTTKDGGFSAECKVKVLPTGTIVGGDDYGRYE